jgi:hypothetical protein
VELKGHMSLSLGDMDCCLPRCAREYMHMFLFFFPWEAAVLHVLAPRVCHVTHMHEVCGQQTFDIVLQAQNHTVSCSSSYQILLSTCAISEDLGCGIPHLREYA